MDYQLLRSTIRHKQYRTRLHIRRIPIRTLCGHEYPMNRWKPVLDMSVEEAIADGKSICEMCLSNWRADMQLALSDVRQVYVEPKNSNGKNDNDKTDHDEQAPHGQILSFWRTEHKKGA